MFNSASHLDAAQAYARELNWRVFPVWGIAADGSCECGGLESCDGGKHAGKHPIPTTGYKAATTDADQIARWWTKHPNAGIGLACDASGVLVVDRDPRNGSEATAARLEADGFKITSELRALTGGGGTHDFFASPAAGWRGAKHQGIDLKHAGYVILPPSRHKSGGAYRWAPGVDPVDVLDMLGLGALPACFTEGATPAAGRIDDDDLAAYTRQKPLGLSEDEILAHLKWLPLADWCEDRDGWFQLGMALHHETEGSPRGFEIWCEFSKQSEKFDAKDSARVWRSFKGAAKPVRMPTIIKAAGLARDEAEFGAGHGDDFEEEEDLLGTPSAGEVDSIDAIGTPSAEASEDKWKERLARDEEGHVKGTMPNLTLIVQHDPRLQSMIRLNDFTQEIVKRGAPGRMPGKTPKGIIQLDSPLWQVGDPINGDLWTDSMDHGVRHVIEAPKRQGGYDLKVTDRDLRAAVDLAAQRQRFHPIREYLETREWDGIARVDFLFSDYLGAEETAYTRQVARMFLVAAVCRVYEPGHKFDFAPILEGLQGKRKSTFIQVLGKFWASELNGDFHDPKGMVEQMQGSWINEIPELSGFGRADVRLIKAFMSCQVDKVRLAYAKRAQMFPRQCVFIGSTNDREYLRDETGGRRFWPIECQVDEIDTDRLADSVDRIWAEALVLYREMRTRQPQGTLPLYLSEAAAHDEALRIQEDRRIETAEDSVVGEVERWLNKPMPEDFEDADDLIGQGPRYREMTCLKELWIECLGNDRRTYNQMAAQTLGKAMRRVPGWEASRHDRETTEKYGRQRVYKRIRGTLIKC